MSQQKSDDVIRVSMELDELDLTAAESKAIYSELISYIESEYGLKASNLYISQGKRKLGNTICQSRTSITSHNVRLIRKKSCGVKAFQYALTTFKKPFALPTVNQNPNKEDKTLTSEISCARCGDYFI